MKIASEIPRHLWPYIDLTEKLDNSAFFGTQSYYITEICYFEYLLSFGLKKTFFSQVQSNLKPN